MVTGSKVQKLVLDDHGSYLGMEKGCFILKDKNDNVKRYPLFEQEIGEIILKSGNTVSTGALASCGFWDIDVLVMTSRGRPVAMLKGLDDDSHVRTRLCQYEAFNNGKWVHIAKQIVLGKFYGSKRVSEKYHLRPLSDKYVDLIEGIEPGDRLTVQRKLMALESKFTKQYFSGIFSLFPEGIRPNGRRTFQAYDGLNNIFNLAYEMLSWKVHRALIKAKLEPYLGFLHSVQFGKPSLVCDLQELYRHLIDDFLIQYCRNLRSKDFVVKTEDINRRKRGKRVYLNDVQTKDLMARLNEFFESEVNIPRIRALQLAKYLRNERNNWTVRIE
ncbi:MAG: CRISPR-associated endonuclease Cas1 [archaeon]|nr:CRISPR-associated endonuclease Cas1 [archaeon]